MQDNIDQAFDAFERLLVELPAFEATLDNEADIRLKVIDTVLMDVLGWTKAEISPEEPSGPGFLDYKLSVEGVGRVVVEAKKASREFGLAGREAGATYKLSGPVFKNDDLQEGIRQAIQYSAYKNTELACVTNGFEWVIFRSNRIGDGTNTLDGKAFQFDSLQSIRSNFRIFFDLLDRSKVANLVFRALFQEAEGKIIRHGGFRKVLRPATSAVFLSQPEIIPELDRLMTSFFQRLSDERDREMLEYCFVETKESQAAEKRLMRLAEDLVGHIRALDTQSGIQLSDLLSRATAASLNQFILLVGTKGAGKSTFIHRFFNSKLSASLRESVVPITVNLADSDGDESSVLDWLRRQLLAKAELALADDAPTWEELIGHMFFGEYQRWSTSTMAPLYKADKEQFKVEFGKHVEAIRRENPVDYIHGLLRNFVKGRKRLPCLIFDNADHFSIDFQERVFQFARSLFEREVCVVLMPITDKTSWQLSRQGALQSFENEALLLPTPSAKQVLEKRINFVLKKMDEDAHKDRGSYFVGKGIRVGVPDLMKFVRGLEEVFLNTDKAVYVIGQLANHSIREVLELARDIVNSPHIGLDEVFKAYVLGSAVHIQDYKTRKALIRGRYDIYVPSSSKYTHNVFDLNTELDTSPLLGLRILQALKDGVVMSGDTKSRYTSKADLQSYMLAMGFEHRAVSLWLDALLKKALVLNYDPTRIDAETATQLEISPSGELHLYWGRGNYDYLLAMAETTALLDPGSFAAMENASRGQGSRRVQEVIGVFVSYLKGEDHLFCRAPDHESYSGQHELAFRLGS
ncbi:AAA domain-containing protein [Variovorax sp. YR266]|uniref:AAA family ATPase n=1 Tax=Variovorax sp. YR266 TaxID=1884386 RepID=UPI00089BE47F|nr:AAA family ATPase [Variovorax sp. YR266]SDZ69520.1 AAA domain-containing protein [Variovorax sp. YR266]